MGYNKNVFLSSQTSSRFHEKKVSNTWKFRPFSIEYIALQVLGLCKFEALAKSRELFDFLFRFAFLVRCPSYKKCNFCSALASFFLFCTTGRFSVNSEFFCSLIPTQCGNLLTHIFDKKFVKLTVLLKS